MARATTAEIEETLRRVGPEMIRVCRGIVGPSGSKVAAAKSIAILAGELSTAKLGASARALAFDVSMRTALNSRRGEKALSATISDSSDASGSGGEKAHANRRGLVRELLDELPKDQMGTLVARFMLGYSVEEVAAVTDVALKTAQARVRKVRVAVKQRLVDAQRLRDGVDA